MTVAVPAGVFWLDEDDALDTGPAERLVLARKYMPLPAAFREALEAIRALILANTKQRFDASDLLSQLYVTAAQESFLLSTAYIPGVSSRYDIAASIPRNVWQQLPMPYADIGYRHLPLLTLTDYRWLVVAWGEPDAHRSAQAYHQAVWDYYVEKYRRTHPGSSDGLPSGNVAEGVNRQSASHRDIPPMWRRDDNATGNDATLRNQREPY